MQVSVFLLYATAINITKRANCICKASCQTQPQAHGMQFRRGCVECSIREKLQKKRSPKGLLLAGETRLVKAQSD